MFIETKIDDDGKKIMNIELEGKDSEDDFSGAIMCAEISSPNTIKIVVNEEYTYDGENLEIDFIAASIGYNVVECRKMYAELVIDNDSRL